MSPICLQFTELYQTWSDSLVLMREARLRYQESGTTKDKQAFDEGLSRARTTQGEYNHEAYETLVEYRDLQICQLEALVIQGMDARLALGGGKAPRLKIESGRVVWVYLNYSTSSTIDSALKLIPYLRSLIHLSCYHTSITELPRLPDSLSFINISVTPAAKDPKVQEKLKAFKVAHPSASVLF